MSDYNTMDLSDLLSSANKGDFEAGLYLTRRYTLLGDYQSAIEWLKKIINDSNHPRNCDAIIALAKLYTENNHPYTNKKEAIKLYESIMNLPISHNESGSLNFALINSRIDLGLLYCEEGEISDGFALIEDSAEKLAILNDWNGWGRGDALSHISSYKIALEYEKAQMYSNAIRYYNRTIKGCDFGFDRDQELMSVATARVEECRKLITNSDSNNEGE